MVKAPIDNRDKTWRLLEKKIQFNASGKDKRFVLKGRWKKFVRIERGYKVFSVDATWIRMNLCVYFGHGGHGLVHEFIPVNEIWITSHHYNDGTDELFYCPCKTKVKNQKCSKNCFDSTAIHEITECEAMKTGKSYWKSHQLSLAAEEQAGLLPDPFTDL